MENPESVSVLEIKKEQCFLALVQVNSLFLFFSTARMSSFFSGILNNVNTATDILSGAIDVVVIRQPVRLQKLDESLIL